MRIADKMQFEQVKTNLGRNRSELANLQNQAATQLRVTKPSDDPVAVTRVLADRSDVQGAEQFIKNCAAAKSQLQMSAESLGEITDALVRAKELALSQSNDASANETSRRVTATEVAQLYDQAIQIANRKLGDRFLFGGYKTTLPPFDQNGKYHGDNGEIQIQINKDATVGLNMAGNKVFFGEGLERANDLAEPPKTIEEFDRQKAQHRKRHAPVQGPVKIRGLASVEPGSTESVSSTDDTASDGVNVFKVLKGLQISLETNDKEGIQESLDQLDSAISQVVLARSEFGSRINAVDNNMNSLQRSNVDAKENISQLQDADTFSLVSDISKTQNTLQATLATSGKLIQPSLLDFLK